MQQTPQQTIHELFNSNVNDASMVYEFNLLDRSVSQKLWSTAYYRDQIVDIDINTFRFFPSASATQSAGSTTTADVMLNLQDYCRHLNRLLDGFFMNSMSTLDTLAHEIFVLHTFHTTPSNIYITTARDMLLSTHVGSVTGALLDNELNKRWFTEFTPFRHCTTHESLIRHDDVTVSYDYLTNRYKLSRKIRLPDNPQLRPFTYSRNRIASDYCQFVSKNIERLVSKVFESVLKDIQRNAGRLPIPIP